MRVTRPGEVTGLGASWWSFPRGQHPRGWEPAWSPGSQLVISWLPAPPAGILCSYSRRRPGVSCPFSPVLTAPRVFSEVSCDRPRDETRPAHPPPQPPIRLPVPVCPSSRLLCWDTCSAVPPSELPGSPGSHPCPLPPTSHSQTRCSRTQGPRPTQTPWRSRCVPAPRPVSHGAPTTPGGRAPAPGHQPLTPSGPWTRGGRPTGGPSSRGSPGTPGAGRRCAAWGEPPPLPCGPRPRPPSGSTAPPPRAPPGPSAPRLPSPGPTPARHRPREDGGLVPAHGDTGCEGAHGPFPSGAYRGHRQLNH